MGGLLGARPLLQRPLPQPASDQRPLKVVDATLLQRRNRRGTVQEDTILLYTFCWGTPWILRHATLRLMPAGRTCRLAQIVNPASLQTGLEHDDRNRLAGKDEANLFRRRLKRAERRNAGAGIVPASDAVVPAKIDRENAIRLHGMSPGIGPDLHGSPRHAWILLAKEEPWPRSPLRLRSCLANTLAGSKMGAGSVVGGDGDVDTYHFWIGLAVVCPATSGIRGECEKTSATPPSSTVRAHGQRGLFAALRGCGGDGHAPDSGNETL